MEEIDLLRVDAFSNVNGSIPAMTTTEIWDHMRIMDPRAYFDATQAISEDDRTDQATVLLWLIANRPLLYDALENILRAFQSAFYVASETRQSLINSYYRFVALQKASEQVEQVAEEAEEPVSKSEKKRKRAPKKKAEQSLPPDLVELEKTIKQSVKEKEARSSLTEHYYAMENFYSEFPLGDFRHFHKKNRTHYRIEEIRDSFDWETIYHVNGPWDAEMLKEKLKQPGRTIIIIKKTRGADSEVMGYKVLVGASK